MENINFKIVDKNGVIKKEVFDLLHQYPGNFVPGLFEKHAELDFEQSDVCIAYDKDRPIGCLMLNRSNNEFLWLAVEKDITQKRSDVAKNLFYTFVNNSKPSIEFILNIPTEDSQISEYPSFSGMNFEKARKMYREMGLEMNSGNRIENFYAQGAHVYHVKWKPK